MSDVPKFLSVTKRKALHRNKHLIPKKIEYKSFGKEVKEEPKDDENMDTCPIPYPSKVTEGDQSVPSRTSPFKGQPSSLQSCGALNAIEKSKALKRISGLKFNDPFFILHIQPSHVQARTSLTVPVGFAKSYIGTGIKHMSLKVGDGKNKSWAVTCNFKEIDRARVYHAGWKAFAQDNALKIGDLCVFEMTKTTESIIFAVSIYRGNRNADSTSVPGMLSAIEKSEALKRISRFKYNKPYFILHIQPTHVQAKPSLAVPLDFAKSYIGTGIKHVILKVGDGKNKSWPVKYILNEGSHRPRFYGGWKAFAQNNALKRGDLCVFAMTKTNKSIIFVVSIYGENRNADSTSVLGIESRKANPVCSERNKRSRKTLTPLPMKSTVEEDPKGVLTENDVFNWSSKASEAAGKFCSRHPLFQVDFPSSSLEMSTLSIPVWFARSYLEAKEQGVTLQVDQRSWDVRLEYNLSNGYSLPQFRRGWFVFVNQNFLDARDSCIFELIQRDQAVFKVYIFRDQV